MGLFVRRSWCGGYKNRKSEEAIRRILRFDGKAMRLGTGLRWFLSLCSWVPPKKIYFLCTENLLDVRISRRWLKG